MGTLSSVLLATTGVLVIVLQLSLSKARREIGDLRNRLEAIEREFWEPEPDEPDDMPEDEAKTNVVAFGRVV